MSESYTSRHLHDVPAGGIDLLAPGNEVLRTKIRPRSPQKSVLPPRILSFQP